MRGLALLAIGAVPALSLQAADTSWCSTGLASPDLQLDAPGESVEVILAQAPLFSVNPKIGQKLGLIGLYHTALVLRQDDRNWTLEFDSVTNVFGAIMPEVAGDHLQWNNAARYCLSPGIYNGRAHWTKSFDVVMRLTAAQTQQLFNSFVAPLNRTDTHRSPLYQLWRLVVDNEVIVRDITCGDGIRWFLHAGLSLGASLPSGFKFRSTQTFVHAASIAVANVTDPNTWRDIVSYYSEWNRLVARNETMLQRLEVVSHLLPMKYVYDSNADKYYRLSGSRFPFIEVSDAVQFLDGPPFPIEASESELEVVTV